MNLKNPFPVLILAAVLLTSILFTAVPENKLKNLASQGAGFTLNSKPKIVFNFPNSQPPEAFIEPTVLAGKLQEATKADSTISNQIVSGEKPKINPADLGPGTVLNLNSLPARIPAKQPVYLPQIFKHAPKIQADQLVGLKLLSPSSMTGVGELLELLKGFGDFINVSKDQLTIEFSRRDTAIIKKTKEVYGNPENFVLGEQCGGEGASWTFPPGATTNTACGGDPEYSVTGGGGACNTDPPCFGTGFCFEECYDYEDGGYCYCWVPSCLGVCGFQSYIWDSVTGTCGCGAFGSEPVVDLNANNAPPTP